jgi:hypothetical protein
MPHASVTLFVISRREGGTFSQDPAPLPPRSIIPDANGYENSGLR